MHSADGSTRIETFRAVDQLPGDAFALFEAADTLFSSRAWWETATEAALPERAEPCFVLIRWDGRPAALFPMLRAGPDAAFAGFTTPYTCLYVPLVAPWLDARGLASVMRAFGRLCGGSPVTRLDAMPDDSAALPALMAGARRCGLVPLRFAHFGNWHKPIGFAGWEGYLAERPGALRETVRRRLRRAERLGEARFVIVTRPEQVDAGVTAFEAVYARSWKEPEPFPRFNAALMRASAKPGWLRLGLWFIGDIAVAAQFWVVEGQRATVLKLAHDEAFKAHSPGTVLTALMLRHLLDQEAVTEVDFGRGDDPYKQGWARARRQRMGVLLVNPMRPHGLATLARHGLGRLRTALRR